MSSLSATRGKFEVLFGFKCHAELAAMDGASGSFKNKYVWHRCGGCVDIFTCVWLKMPLLKMRVCRGVSEVSIWCKRVDRECVGPGRKHVMLHASLRTCVRELSAMVFASRCVVSLLCMLVKPVCVSPCARASEATFHLCHAWTKVRFLDLFSRLTSFANGTIFLFLRRATCLNH